MGNTVKVTLDDKRKSRAVKAFAKSNLSLPNAIRLFIDRSIKDNGFPVSLLMPDESEMDPDGFWALQNMRRISEMNGNSNMTLDDINAEIDAYRKGL